MPGRTIKSEKRKEKPKKRGRPKKSVINVKVKTSKKTKEEREKKIKEEIEQIKASEKIDKNVHKSNPKETKHLLNNELEEGRKIVIMWSGVAFFMILIGGFWLYNTKKVFQSVEVENSNSEFSLSDWGKMADDVSKKMSELKKGVEEIKNIKEESDSMQTEKTEEVNGKTVDGLSNEEDVSIEKLKTNLIATTSGEGEVKGAFEDLEIVNRLKNKLENK